MECVRGTCVCGIFVGVFFASPCLRRAFQVTVYVYELLDGDVKVDKIEFSKPAPSQGL